MYWGTTNGGQTEGNWANSSAPTSPSQPQGAAPFYTNITGLSPSTLYYFSAKAVNYYGTRWVVASLTFTTTSVDIANPTVSTLSPADNATAVALDSNLVITFSEAVDAEAGANNDIIIKKTSDNSTIETIDAQDAKVTGSGTAIITINLSATLSGETSYYVQIGADAFDDGAGNSYAGIADTTTWNFTTADVTNPTVSTLSPADNATAVALDSNLVITFSEAVDAETGNIVIKKTSDNSTLETIDVTSGNVTGSGTAIITINPTTDFAYETEYYIQIDATAFDDAVGNSYAGISNTTTWSFTTEDTPTCPNLANTATYNAYPTCGVATCNVGYRLSNGACVAIGGSGLPVDALNTPTAPVGGFKVSINNNAESTNSSKVTLSLVAGDNVKNMAISNFSDFTGAGQELFQTTKQWDICEGRTTYPDGEYTVYVKFYTKYGQASEIVQDSILYKNQMQSQNSQMTQQQELALIAQIKKQLISLITQLIQLLTAKVGEMR
jgi:methionine-rich copper-binding protein CopC